MKVIKESKMKRKKAGIFAAAAAALVITALVISCMEPIDPSGLLGGFGNYPPPSAGKTYLNLNINEAVARTVYPVAPGGTITYDLIFTDTSGGGTNSVTKPGWTTGLVEVEELTSYSLTVNAKSGSVVFATTAAPITFTTGATGSLAQTVTVNNLQQIVNGGDGTFKWAFTAADINLAGGDTATLAFDNTSGGGTGTAVTSHVITAAETLNNTASTGIAIESGYYNVTLTLTKSGHNNRVISEVLHIFEGHTSTWTYTIPAMIPEANYSVTFNDPDTYWDATITGALSTYNKTGITTHGERLAASDAPPLNWDTALITETFTGWSTYQGSGGNLWVFNAATGTRLLSSINLYPKFQSTKAELTISLTAYSLPGEIELPIDSSTNATTVSIDNIYNGLPVTYTRTIIIDTTGLNMDGNLTWKYNGAALAAGTAIAFSGTNNTTMQINFKEDQAATLGINQEGMHVFTVSGGVDGTTWAAMFSITVNP